MPEPTAAGAAAGRRVAVIGGGLAGITAALDAADAGAEVTLLERQARLGGRTWSFEHNGLTFDNGQHVFMRCCTSYRAFVERIGGDDLVTLQPRLDVPVLSPGRPPGRIARTGLPAPLHLAGSLARYRPLAPAARVRAVLAARRLGSVDPDDQANDLVSFGSWLAEHGQDERATAALWDLVGRPTLNLPAADASLALAAKVFRTGLLDRADAGDLGWSDVPLGVLHGDVAAAALAGRGVDVVTSTRVSEVAGGADAFVVRTAEGPAWEVDAVVVAVTHRSVTGLLAPSLRPPGWVGDRDPAALGSSPIVNVHVVYDRRVTDHAFFAAVDSPAQFVFDRTRPAGLQGGGQYLAISLSAADEQLATSADELVATMSAALAELLPAASRARVVDGRVTRERHATFRGVPGSAAHRAAAASGTSGLAFAGAWTDTGWPDTMEGAVRSGHAAARAALTAAVRPERRVDALPT